MKLNIVFFLLFILSFAFISNAQRVIDTVDTPYGKMLIYSNKTWAFFNKPVFDGVMNSRIHKIMTENQDIPFMQSWKNDVCFTSKNNNLTKLKDTVWLNIDGEINNDFKVPVPGVVNSNYGFRHGKSHNGIDLNLKTGDTVCSAWSGKVRYAKYNDGGFGNLVIIRHYNGLETFYAHLSKIFVFPDQDVLSGETIGLGGSTGHSSGPHLHFEVRFYDSPINPAEYIDFTTKTLKKPKLFVHKLLFNPGAKPSDYFDDSQTTEITNPSDSSNTPQVFKKPIVKVKKDQVRYYRVKSGDTLSKIAAKNNTTVSKLCKLNGIKPNSIIQVGKSLKVK